MKTFTSQSSPWGIYNRTGHKLLCSDGVIRSAELASTADTFFSVPAKIRIKGRWISGYMTTEEERWISGVRETEPFACALTFHQHTTQTNPHHLPSWHDLNPSQINHMIRKAQ